MPASSFASRVQRAVLAAAPIMDFLNSPLARRGDDPRAANFLFGNPQEMPLPGFVSALQRSVEPRHKDWFAYTVYHRPAQEAVAATLQDRYNVLFSPDDVLMTTGAFGGLSLLLTALLEPGDEVVYLSPPWFFYEPMILLAGGTPVRVRLEAPSFDLDLQRIVHAMTPRTRAVIVNSAQNPTGRVYPSDALRLLAQELQSASDRNGRPIFLFSDEAYSHLLYDGCTFHTPTAFYPYAFLIYTYGKVLLTPGQRIGYVALAPSMPDAEEVRRTLLATQMMQGWTFPNAAMQYAVPELERMSIDIGSLERKRNRLVAALRGLGYSLAAPESTFYLLPKSPLPDEQAFCERLAADDVLCMPGRVFDLPGYFRISLTVSDDMIDRSLDVFRLCFSASAPES